jgi:hypothetical protein
MAGSFVGAPGDYLGMIVDVVVTSAQRVEASSMSRFASRGTVLIVTKLNGTPGQ